MRQHLWTPSPTTTSLRGRRSKNLTFAYEVVQPNESTRGIAVLADTLEANGGAVRSASTGTDAELAHTRLGHEPAHKAGDGTASLIFAYKVVWPYGFSVFGAPFVSTPEIGLSLSQSDRELRVDWRHELVRSDRMALEAGIEATRREAAYDETGIEHGRGLRLSARW